MASVDFSAAVIGTHALAQMARRGIAEAQVRQVLANPQNVNAVRAGRVVVQGAVRREGRGVYLLRAFIDVDRTPPVVVTLYLTSKIAKYGGRP